MVSRDEYKLSLISDAMTAIFAICFLIFAHACHETTREYDCFEANQNNMCFETNRIGICKSSLQEE